MPESWIEKIGLIAGIVLPLWNLPLIARIIRRRSSQDLSLWWVMGVWVCIVLMTPSGLVSKDVVWKSFSMLNLIFFSAVAFVSLKYRSGSKDV
jgi:uncharacterized protein with PQ loop repeat